MGTRTSQKIMVPRSKVQWNVYIPPTAPITPPEHIPYVAYDPDFVPSLFSAYEWSLYSDHIRARKYGSEVAEAYRRGLTPEESRRRWEDQVKRSRAYVDASSDSEG